MTTSTFELNVDGGSASSADAVVTGVVKELVLLDQILGTGDGTATTVGATLIGPRRTGTNVTGSDVIFAAGNGTGTGGGGNLIFKAAAAGSSGSTGNTLAEAMRIDNAGNVGIGVTPSFKFHVRQDNNNANTYIGIENLGTGSAAAISYLGVADGYAQHSWTRNGGTPYGGIQWSGNSGSVFYLSGANTNDALIIQSNNGTTTIGGTGNVIIGTGAIATTATVGFPWIPSCAGAPTGAPAAPYTNAAALVVDTTNSKLYVRVGTAWKSVSLA